MTPALFAGRRRGGTKDTAPISRPHAVPEPAPHPDAPEDPQIRHALATWRTELSEIGGPSALADIGLLADRAVEISAPHPSGLAQLYAGRSTPLANLVRDQALLRTARQSARAVLAHARQLQLRYGIQPTQLAIGVASWTETDDDGSRQISVPALLRPIALGAAGNDFDLQLETTAAINPVLARRLRGAGALLDPRALAESCFAGGGFAAAGALDHLRAIGTALAGDFAVNEHLVIGVFERPGQQLIEDLDRHMADYAGHEVVAALAGNSEAIERLAATTLPTPVHIDAPPERERGVGDLTPGQRDVIMAVAAGHHAYIDAAPGAPVPETIAAVIADAARFGRSVLYVPGKRRRAEATARHLHDLGLGELLLDVQPTPGWRQQAVRHLLSGAGTGAPEIDAEALTDIRTRLGQISGELADYISALHLRREPWQVSAYDALQALARLTALRPAPRSQVRYSPQIAHELLGSRRETIKARLQRCAELGEFRPEIATSAWYGARIMDERTANRLADIVERVRGEQLTTVAKHMVQVAEATGLEEPHTLDAWGEQLDMLAGIREALDVFLPIIFEKSPDDMVAATASRTWRTEHGIEMGNMIRRRLRKQARDLVRPGLRIEDLHGALLHVQQQREIWVRWCPAGAWPRLPQGMAQIDADYRRLREDLEELSEVLQDRVGPLGAMPVEQLYALLQRLAKDRDTLKDLPERTVIELELAEAGLGDLLEDLKARRVLGTSGPSRDEDLELIGAELELTWWGTVLEEILRQDPALADRDGVALAELTESFRKLDLAHLAAMPAETMRAVADAIAVAVTASPEQTLHLEELAAAGQPVDPATVATECPDLAMRLRPCWSVAPMLVPPAAPAPGQGVDLVIVDATGSLPVSQALAAIVRGRQVVFIGDQSAAPESLASALRPVLPHAALAAQVARRDPALTGFLAQHGYAGLLAPAPLPSNRPLAQLELVAGTGMPAPGDNAVESVDAEVRAVVDLVISHALERPQESLAVITVSARHADRVRQAIAEELETAPAVAEFFDPSREEPFAVATLASALGLARESIILSLGYGKTPHGRVLHNFGPLAEEDGDSLLLDAVAAARQRLTVVSCFGAEDLDENRLRTPGTRLLADLLRFMAEGLEASAHLPTAHTPDTLLVDLAERLWRRGLKVEPHYGVDGGEHIPLAIGHPELPGELLVAVLTDDGDYVRETSVRVRTRQRADRLKGLGWRVVQTWSAAVFLDPDAEADAIERAVLEEAGRRLVRMPTPMHVTAPDIVD